MTMMKDARYVDDKRQENGLGLEEEGKQGNTSFQPSGFYNARWSSRQARRRKMAGNFECRPRDVRVTGAGLRMFSFAICRTGESSTKRHSSRV